MRPRLRSLSSTLTPRSTLLESCIRHEGGAHVKQSQLLGSTPTGTHQRERRLSPERIDSPDALVKLSETVCLRDAGPTPGCVRKTPWPRRKAYDPRKRQG